MDRCCVRKSASKDLGHTNWWQQFRASVKAYCRVDAIIDVSGITCGGVGDALRLLSLVQNMPSHKAEMAYQTW
jgi:hypothetical protein